MKKTMSLRDEILLDKLNSDLETATEEHQVLKSIKGDPFLRGAPDATVVAIREACAEKVRSIQTQIKRLEDIYAENGEKGKAF